MILKMKRKTRSFLTFVVTTESFLAIGPSQYKFLINEFLMKKSVHCLIVQTLFNSIFYSPLYDCLSLQVSDDCAVHSLLYVTCDVSHTVGHYKGEMGCLSVVNAHNDPQLIIGVLESDEYRDSFDHHLLGPSVA